MSFLSDLVVWCKEERESLLKQQELLERKEIEIKEKRGGRDVDTTADTLARVKKTIAKLDALLARQSADR
jgi:hypothetical protein